MFLPHFEWRGRHFTKVFIIIIISSAGVLSTGILLAGILIMHRDFTIPYVKTPLSGILPSGPLPVGILSPLVAAISREAMHTQQFLSVSYTCTYPHEYFIDHQRQTDVEWHVVVEFCLH